MRGGGVRGVVMRGGGVRGIEIRCDALRSLAFGHSFPISFASYCVSQIYLENFLRIMFGV